MDGALALPAVAYRSQIYFYHLFDFVPGPHIVFTAPDSAKMDLKYSHGLRTEYLLGPLRRIEFGAGCPEYMDSD